MLTNKLEVEALSDLHVKLSYIENGGQVVRCHMVPTIKEQNVAAHSFGVAWWVYLLTKENKPTVNLLMAALQHDLPEGVTGDIPAPTKRTLRCGLDLADWEVNLNTSAGLPAFETLLTECETRILKLADSLELLQLCLRERSMGNRTRQLGVMFENVKNYAREVSKTQLEASIINNFVNQWENS